MAWGSLRSACYPFRRARQAARPARQQQQQQQQLPIVTVLKLPERGVPVCVRQLVVVIAALMPPVHIDMTRSALFIPSSTKAIIFVVVAQFLLIYIDEMCVTTATTTRKRNENKNTSNNGNNNNNNRKLRSRRLCLLSYHAQLDNFHLPNRPGRKRERERERMGERGGERAGAFSSAEPGRVFCEVLFWLLIELRARLVLRTCLALSACDLVPTKAMRQFAMQIVQEEHHSRQASHSPLSPHPPLS